MRQEQLEQFRRTGRVVSLASDTPATSLDHLQSAEIVETEAAAAPKSRLVRRFLDGLLLLIEAAAVLGIIYVYFTFTQRIQEVNQQTSVELKQPTFTSTPLITALVLPSGHTPPTSPGGAAPNDAEIPEHLRPLVQSLLANPPIPTPGPEQAIRIQIPAIGVDAPVVQGDGWEQLKKGVGQNIGSANPGQTGNVVLAAHNDVFGEIFRYLDKLKKGDQVILYTNQHAYTYIVSKSQVVEPTQVEFMAPTEQPVVTLISCYPYLVDTQRIIVVAHLQTSNK